MELKEFGNGALKVFGEALLAKKLSPKSIQEIAAFVRAIVASALNAEGEELFPRKWNLEFADLPTIGERKKGESVTPQQLANALKSSRGVFYALLAGTGLRIGEAIAVRIGSDDRRTCWDPDASVVHVRTSVWNRQEQWPKTPAAVRSVDLDQRLNELLKKFADERTGFLFVSNAGGMLSVSTLRSRLQKLGISGFHCFRRYCISRLRENGTPEDIIRYWAGHAGAGITDRYSKLGENIESSKAVGHASRTWF